MLRIFTLLMLVGSLSVSAQKRRDTTKGYNRLGADGNAPRFQGYATMPRIIADVLAKTNQRPGPFTGDQACRQVIQNSYWCSANDYRYAAFYGRYTKETTIPETLDRAYWLLEEMKRIHLKIEELKKIEPRTVEISGKIEALETLYAQRATQLNFTFRFLNSNGVDGKFNKNGKGHVKIYEQGYLNLFCTLFVCRNWERTSRMKLRTYIQETFSNFFSSTPKPSEPPYFLQRPTFKGLIEGKNPKIDYKKVRDVFDTVGQIYSYGDLLFDSRTQQVIGEFYFSTDKPLKTKEEYETQLRDCQQRAKRRKEKNNCSNTVSKYKPWNSDGVVDGLDGYLYPCCSN